MVKRSGRLQIGALSEYYKDLLKADAYLANSSIANQGKVLLQNHLAQRESVIKTQIAYLAQKRGLEFQQLWDELTSEPDDISDTDE